MFEMEGFVPAGRRARRSFASAPEAEFDFGPWRVHSQVTIPTGLPRRGVGSKTVLDVLDPESGSTVRCEFDRVGMPLGSELMHGIGGRVDVRCSWFVAPEGLGSVVRTASLMSPAPSIFASATSTATR